MTDARPDPWTGLEPQAADLLRTMQDTWNRADVDAMFADAHPDLHWVNVVGMHWHGRAAVRHAHAVFFERMFRGVPLTLEAVESDRTLPGGVRLIVVRWLLGAFRTPAGDLRPAAQNRMTVVAVPGPSGLQIVHAANIEVDPHAAPHDPAPPPPGRA